MFFRDLFDLRFDRFVTYRVASLLFVVGIMLNTIAAAILFIFFSSTTRNLNLSWTVGFFVILVILVLWLISIVLWRVILESLVALVLSGDYAKKTFDNLRSGQLQQNPSANFEKSVSSAREAAKPSPLGHSSAQVQVAQSTTQTLLEDYNENPREWVYSVFTSGDIELWMRAGSPNLRPYILEGMPDLRKWLKKNRLL